MEEVIIVTKGPMCLFKQIDSDMMPWSVQSEYGG